jgi:ankyrin repeat protein
MPTLRDAWLLRTARKGDEQEVIVTLLVPTEGIDVNSKDEDRRTPLLWVENEHKDIVKLLLAKASANTEDTIGRHHSHSLP